MGWTVSRRDHQEVEKILQEIMLVHNSSRFVSDLSGGEMQLVMIARALAQSPRVLLLDEPTSSLDIKNQMQIMTMIRKVVKEKGISAVVSIHDLNLAVRFSDSFPFLKDNGVHSMLSRSELNPETTDVYGVDVK